MKTIHVTWTAELRHFSCSDYAYFFQKSPDCFINKKLSWCWQTCATRL